MITGKTCPDERHRGIWCPMRACEGRCVGASCAWWVADTDESGHCAVLDLARPGATERAEINQTEKEENSND